MGIRDLFRHSSDSPQSPQQLTDEQLAELRETARSWIAPGFQQRDGMAAELAEYHDDIEAPDEVKLAAAETVVEEEWQRRLDEQATWTGRGDYERLVSAFDALAVDGVLGRMNFTCCQTCGSTEIDDERTPIADAAEGTYPFREWGYTFFHQQDTERLTDAGAVLYLTYSTFRPAPGLDEDLLARARGGDDAAREEVVRQSDVAVGHRVADALQAAGLTVDWNGENTKRIAVTDLDWRKPLPVG
jgi:hypothetical protein